MVLYVDCGCGIAHNTSTFEYGHRKYFYGIPRAIELCDIVAIIAIGSAAAAAATRSHAIGILTVSALLFAILLTVDSFQ